MKMIYSYCIFILSLFYSFSECNSNYLKMKMKMKIQQKKSECNGCCRRKEGFKPKTDNVEIVIFRGISEGGKGSSVGDNKMNVNNDKNKKKKKKK